MVNIYHDKIILSRSFVQDMFKIYGHIFQNFLFGSKATLIYIVLVGLSVFAQQLCIGCLITYIHNN